MPPFLWKLESLRVVNQNILQAQMIHTLTFSHSGSTCTFVGPCGTLWDLVEGASDVGKDHSWGEGDLCVTICSLNTFRAYLPLINVTRFVFYSESSSKCHFLFRIGWTLRRKLKNRFEVSSFALFSLIMGILGKLGCLNR